MLITLKYDLIMDRLLIFKEYKIDKLQNLKSSYRIEITLSLKGFPTQFKEMKKNYQNSTIKNSMEQIFM